MKESVLRKIVEEYEDMKKISKGDFSEIEKLEENPAVQRYKYLLGLKESRFEFTNEDNVVWHFLSEYGHGFIQETNDIWCLVYETSAMQYEKLFKKSLNEFDKDSIVLVYFDIENNQKYIVINKDEQEIFESTHNVITGKLSIYDSVDRYSNVRHEFWELCLKDGQEKAVQRILTKYSKTKDRN